MSANKKEAWVFEYLSKKGKSLNTLEKTIMNLSKATIIERFKELDWGLTLAHSKVEMASMIIDELLKLGYKYEKVGEGKKEVKPIVKFNSPYFKSQLMEVAFYLLELDGDLAELKLGIKPEYYGDKEAAEAWHKEILKRLHGKTANTALVKDAEVVANRYYQQMVNQ